MSQSKIFIKNGNVISVSGVKDIVDIADEVTDEKVNWLDKPLLEDVIIVVVENGEAFFLEVSDYDEVHIPEKGNSGCKFHEIFYEKDIAIVLPDYETAIDYLINYYGGEHEEELRFLGEYMIELELEEAAAARAEFLLQKDGFKKKLLSLFELDNYPQIAKEQLAEGITQQACLFIQEFRRNNPSE